MNGQEIGTWTSPGDMGDLRGRLNPGWWADGRSQYGFFKTWSVSREGSYIDGVPSSSVTLKALGLSERTIIKVRIGNKENAEHIGGVTVFGRGFGNYDQDIVLYMEHD